MNNNWYNPFDPYGGGGPPPFNYYDNVSNVVAQSRHMYDAELRTLQYYSNNERPLSYEEFRRDRGYDERYSAEDDDSMPWDEDGWGKRHKFWSDPSWYSE